MPSPTAPHAIDVRYVADLARLELTAEETAKYQAQLGVILHHVEQLLEADVAGVEPTAHATRLVNVLREDKVQPERCLDRAAVLANAPAVLDDQFIKVPAVIEGEDG